MDEPHAHALGSRISLRSIRATGAAVLVLALACGAHGEGAPDFYKHRQIQLIVGYEAGNDYDLGARLLARYLPRHIPGQPTIIVQNMPQAAGTVAANSLYVRAPRDGTVLASISRNLASQAALGQPNIEADPRRFIWLGATSFPGRICVAASSAAVKSAADLFTRELMVGSVGTGSSTSIVPTVLNRVLGTKFRLIEGYRGTSDIVLAIERGEVEGACASLGQFRNHERLIRDGKLRIILRAEEAAMPEIPGVPSIFDYAKSAEQRDLMRFVFSSTEFGRPYVFPPDVPKDRVEIMRKAIAETAQDAELAADAAKAHLDMAYRPPDHLERLVASLYETPPALIDTVKKLVPNLR
jgi:tripartite-type tricarboxylate transporter receptor subunit TctC